MLPIIICTSSAEHIGKSLEKRNIKIIYPSKNRDGKNFFPDGEIYVALAGIKRKDEKCVIIHSGSPNPNKGLMELRIILEILNQLKVKKIELFFTYFPYGMQDGIFDKGEANIAECLIKEFVNYYSVKKIYVIDAHFFKKPWTKKYPIKNIGVFAKLKERVRRDFPDIFFISPDEGAVKRNGIIGAVKKRINSSDVSITEMKNLEKVVKGKNVGVIDDILETGGTLAKFYDRCKAIGAKKMAALVTHSILKEGLLRIKYKYNKLYLTNSTKQPSYQVDLTGTILEYLN